MLDTTEVTAADDDKMSKIGVEETRTIAHNLRNIVCFYDISTCSNIIDNSSSSSS